MSRAYAPSMRWRIEQAEDGTWSVIRPDGTVVQAGITASAANRGDGRAIAIAAMVAAIGGADALRALVAAPPPAAEGDDTGDDTAMTEGRRWVSDAAFEGVVTNDGRVLAAGTTTFREPPLPLMLQTVTAYGHDGAELVGMSDTGSREGSGDGATLRMAGVFLSNEDGADAVALLDEATTFGVSVDMGWPESYEWECTALDDDGWCETGREVYYGSPILGLTMTPFPAFASARIWMDGVTPPALAQQDTLLSDAPEAVEPTAEDDLLLLIASAATSLDAPPAAWFADPEFTAEHPDMEFSADGCPLGVPMTVTDDGRVYGHVATWSQCHTGYSDRCVLAPRSEGGAYSWFRTGYVQCDDGTRVPTGNLTMGGGHADLSMNAREAMAHYDDACTAWSQVAAGEDEFGIWVAGSLLPGVTNDQVRLARSLSLSGDWRPVGGRLEMIAALAVNVPGFPIPRGLRAVTPRELVASAMPASRETGGEVVALVAAGMVVNRNHRLLPTADTPWGREVERRLALLDARTLPLMASAQAAIVAAARRAD